MVLRDEGRLPDPGLPPEEVRITELQAEPWPNDSRRVRVYLHITPFLERPDLEVVIADAEGQKIASINIIETIENIMTFTMHLRGPDEPEGQYFLTASLFYHEKNTGVIDQKTVVFVTNKQS